MACSESAVTPGGGGLAIQVVAADGVALVADQVRVHLESPGRSTQVRLATPGTQETFGNLDPGTYTVALEGLVGNNEVEWFAEATVTLQADQERTVSPTARSFVPALTEGGGFGHFPPDVAITYAWTPVVGAESYRVEIAADSDFTSPRVLDTGASSADIMGDPGPNFVRVRAVNRFSNLGVASGWDMFTVSAGTGSISGTVTVEGQALAGIPVEVPEVRVVLKRLCRTCSGDA